MTYIEGMIPRIASEMGVDGVIDIFTALGGASIDPNLTCDGT